jgi:hypothetical protein
MVTFRRNIGPRADPQVKDEAGPRRGWRWTEPTAQPVPAMIVVEFTRADDGSRRPFRLGQSPESHLRHYWRRGGSATTLARKAR